MAINVAAKADIASSTPVPGIDPETFEALRPYLFAIAYRMLGSASDAEDAIQEAYVRLASRPAKDLRSPKAYLSTVVTRLCLDQLAATRVDRQAYRGPWLPEPVPTEDLMPGPEGAMERREEISLACLVLLEHLTPEERAIYVLREAFDYPFREIAQMLDKSVPATRQLAHWARARLAGRPRFVASPQDQRRLAERFLAATRRGDLPALTTLLADDVTGWADGGAKTRAARRPIRGHDAVARWLVGVHRILYADARATFAKVNGGVGALLWVDAELVTVTVLDVDAERVQTVRSVSNPDKLAYLHRRLSPSHLVAHRLSG
jgi:RNA polymerase sigma-70 factor (ECF subfamily)